MENPPDLIVAVTSDDQHPDKKKLFVDHMCKQDEQQTDDLVANLRSDKFALECELQQLRARLAVRNENEFAEQSHLLQQRFQEEIQAVLSHHTELVHRTASDLSAFVTDVLRKSIEDIESLRLLHQRELCTFSKNLSECIHHQSCEMNELCEHLTAQQRSNAADFVPALLDKLRCSLNGLKTSFDSKMNYLSDIHASTLENLNRKHQLELTEMKCELSLLSHPQLKR